MERVARKGADAGVSGSVRSLVREERRSGINGRNERLERVRRR